MIAASSIATFRWLVGAAPDDIEAFARFQAYECVAAVAARSGSRPAGSDPYRGGGLALLAGPVSVALALAGYPVLNEALGGQLDAALIAAFARPAVVLGLTSACCWPRSRPSGRGVVPMRRASSGRPEGSLARSVAVVLVASIVVAAGLGAGVLSSRHMLIGRGPAVRDAVTDTVIDLQTELLAEELRLYHDGLVAVVTDEYVAATRAADEILVDPATTTPPRLP